MALLYYKDPGTQTWVPFGTSDPVANEVQVVAGTPPTDLLTELWVDPTGTGTQSDWPAYDERYVSKTNPDNAAMSVPLTLSGDPVAGLHAVTKQYVDAQVTLVSRATHKAHMPVGSITQFAGKNVPYGWHRCDGSPHNSWGLQNALESPDTPNIPATNGFGYIIYGGA